MAARTLDFSRMLGLNPQVHQAVGMISVQISDSLEAAAMQLMVAADASGDSLDAVAADITARRTQFVPTN